MKQVALFAQYRDDFGEHLGKDQILSKRWAVWDQIKQEISIYPVEETNEQADAFLDQVRDTLSKESTYSEYVRQFRPIMAASSKEITSIVMRCVSKYDPSVPLTKDQWAITVVSARKRSRLEKNESLCCSVDPQFGHAMIACEGLEHHRLFCEYAHIIFEKDKESQKSQAKAKVENNIRADTVNGPTWRRSRDSVNTMLQSIRRAQPIDFSLMKDPIDSAKYFLSRIAPLGFIASTIAALFSLRQILYYSHLKHSHKCFF